MNAEAIKEAFKSLESARETAKVAAKSVLANEHTLDRVKAQQMARLANNEEILPGIKPATNDKGRDAQVKMAVVNESNSLYDSQMNQIDAMSRLEIAKDKIKEIDFILRIEDNEYHSII